MILVLYFGLTLKQVDEIFKDTKDIDLGNET